MPSAKIRNAVTEGWARRNLRGNLAIGEPPIRSRPVSTSSPRALLETKRAPPGTASRKTDLDGRKRRSKQIALERCLGSLGGHGGRHLVGLLLAAHHKADGEPAGDRAAQSAHQALEEQSCRSRWRRRRAMHEGRAPAPVMTTAASAPTREWRLRRTRRRAGRHRPPHRAGRKRPCADPCG